MESKKPINIYESDYNILTLIAKKKEFVYPEGHSFAGRMNAAATVHHIIMMYQTIQQVNSSVKTSLEASHD